MALVLYSQFIQFPGGEPASNFPVPVYLRASNVLARLFSDSAGTTPAANPFTTDSEGFMSWYAAPGDYEAWMSGFAVRIPLDSSVTAPVKPDLWVHDQSTPSSLWTVAHHFGTQPSVTCLVAGQYIEADVAHPNDETTTISFAGPTVGVAYLRR